MRSTTSGRSWSTSARRASPSVATVGPTIGALLPCADYHACPTNASRVRGRRAVAGCPAPSEPRARRPRRTRALEAAGVVERPNVRFRIAPAMSKFTYARESPCYDRSDATRIPMGANEPVGTHLARLLPGADAGTLRRLEGAAQHQAFRRRDLLHARGIQLPPFVVLDGHVMNRRVAETGQVYAALIAGPGYLGGLRSISDPDAEAFYELVALSDGTWATWDPRAHARARAAGRRAGRGPPRPVGGLRHRPQHAARRTVLRECAPADGHHPHPVREGRSSTRPIRSPSEPTWPR